MFYAEHNLGIIDNVYENNNKNYGNCLKRIMLKFRSTMASALVWANH